MSKDMSLLRNQSSLQASNVPRVNIVAVLAFFAPLVLGLLASLLLWNPIGIIAWTLPGVACGSSTENCEAVGKRRCVTPGALHGFERTRPVLDHSLCGYDSRLDRSRVITTSFAAEETLTSDTVPVNVDAVLFWDGLRS